MQAVGSEVLQQGVESAVPQLLSGAGSEFLSQAGQEGISQIAPEVLSGAVQNGPLPTAGILAASPPPLPPVAAPLPVETLPPVAGAPTGIQTASGPATSDVAGFQNDQAVLNMVKNYQGGPQPELSPEVLEAAGIKQVAPNVPAPTRMTEADLAQMTFAETGQYPNQPLISEPPGAVPDVSMGPSSLVSEPPTNPFMEGFASVKNFVKNNRFESAVIGYAGLAALNSLGPKEDPRKKRTYVNKYPISPNFQPSRPQPNVYQPRYAEGGITSFDDEAGVDQFAPGGSAREKRDPDADFKRYSSMMNARPEVEADEEALRKPRFARDDDAETRYQDALTAALIRQNKNYARANIGSPSVKRPTPLGTLNLGPPGAQRAASGGIMGYNLGGYAAGGNPRLLKGPGDGMSDDIPAVIGRKQPARLADGEFVVPADVVSHLGNGSTDAGAKKLHQMMDRIRTDRTGKKKQAPEVNADKYLPGKKKAAGGIASIAGYAKGGITGYAEGGQTYSDAQVAQAVAESMAQGFSLAESIQGGMQNYGISQEQADRAAAVVNAYQEGLGRAPDPAGAAYWAGTGLSGTEIAAAIAASPEAKTTRTASSPNTSGGTYADKTFSDAAVASYLAGHNAKTPAEISQIQNAFGVTSDQIARAQALIARNDPSIGDANRLYTEAIAARPGAVKENADAVVTQIFTQQLGRAPDAAGLQYWSNLLQNGGNTQSIVAGIAQSKEGQDMDLQSATSAYRQALGRNPEPGGMQYWFSVAQNEGLSSKQLQDRITAAANAERTVRNIAPGEKFTQMQLDALGANPYAGYYSDKSIYDIAPDAKNVSMIGNRQVQFTTPVTQQAVVSQFVDGIYTAKQGLDMLNTPHAIASLNVALANGSLSTKDYDSLINDLNSSKTPAEVRAALSKPQGQVVIDAAYGQQIGEAATLAEAQREAAQRQKVLTGIDPGYYLSNRALTDAYQKAGVSTPFQYDFYKGVDTRDRKDVMVTPENFLTKRDELTNAVRANPYRVEYDAINRGIGKMPDSVRDPYSDEGLKILYGQMMDQYGVPDPGRPNPATIPTTPYTYKPPVVNNTTLNTPIVDKAAPAPTETSESTGFYTAPSGQVYASKAAYDAAANAGGGGGGKAGGIARGIASIKHKKRKA
jgi:hypothetical protein